MIVRQQDLLICFLCETKWDTAKLNLIIVSLGFGKMARVNSCGQSSGLGLSRIMISICISSPLPLIILMLKWEVLGKHFTSG